MLRGEAKLLKREPSWAGHIREIMHRGGGGDQQLKANITFWVPAPQGPQRKGGMSGST